MIKFNPQRIHNHPALRYLMWFCFTVPAIVILLSMAGLMQNVFMMFMGLWGFTTAFSIFIWANRNGVINAYKTKQISEGDYRHWKTRTLIGFLLSSPLAVIGAIVFLFMLVDTKVNLTITAVPTPELMAQMKYFLNDPDVRHSEVEFDGTPKEIVFYVRKGGIKSNYIYFMQDKIDFIPKLTVDNRDVFIDYNESSSVRIFNINSQDNCYLTFESTDKVIYEKPNEIQSDIESILSIQAYSNKIIIDVSKFYEIRKGRTGKFCFTRKFSENPTLGDDFSIFSNHVKRYLKFPHIYSSIDAAKQSTKKGITSWEGINNSFQGLVR
jgi:hypothetical protein